MTGHIWWLTSDDGDELNLLSTSTLHVDNSGKARLTVICRQGTNNPLADTDFYIFKQVTDSDQPKYGMSIFNAAGNLVFTTSGPPLVILGQKQFGEDIEYMDEGPPLGVHLPTLQMPAGNWAIMPFGVRWLYDYGGSASLWMYRMGAAIFPNNKVKLVTNAGLRGVNQGGAWVVPNGWTPEVDIEYPPQKFLYISTTELDKFPNMY